MDYDSLLELVKQRRSIRSFKPEPIPDEYVDKIIEAARWAPSGANSQPWEFIVVKKPEVKDKIAELVMEQGRLRARLAGVVAEGGAPLAGQDSPPRRPGYADAPVYIILCGDTRAKDIYLARGNFTPDSVQASSLANAFLYMHLAATTLGLASQWVSASAGPLLQRLIKGFLGIPRELEIYDLMAVGYPAAEPRPRQVRIREELVHYDCYDKNLFRSEEKVKEFSTQRDI